jgi:hypothetical protein
MNHVEQWYRSLEERLGKHPALTPSSDASHPVNVITTMLRHAVHEADITRIDSPDGTYLGLSGVQLTFNVAAVHKEGGDVGFSVFGVAGSAGDTHRTDDTQAIEVMLVPKDVAADSSVNHHIRDRSANEFLPALEELRHLLVGASRAAALNGVTINLNYVVDDSLNIRIIAVGDATTKTTHGVKLTFKAVSPALE